ncbi:hypothetical protein DV711_07000 [Motiliproteus coralliicola]|uniref:Uncharacterized protein n=1 Tax=Motiliproteus coralliicola TaxID=2283196 RepID=A0A369WJY0_9GAMM|nr:hypothetical protein DV711_07000 [Motiliproteus coralliicola]
MVPLVFGLPGKGRWQYPQQVLELEVVMVVRVGGMMVVFKTQPMGTTNSLLNMALARYLIEKSFEVVVLLNWMLRGAYS